jgi:opacity protein-like surface antigen
MRRALVALAAVALLSGLAFVRGCSGPRPQLVSARMRGPVAEAIVRNGSFGEGQIQVDFRVHPRAGGAPFLHSEKPTLRPHETARIEVRIDGARGDEQLDVEVDYPPR